MFDWLSVPANHDRRNQSKSFVLSTRAPGTSCIIFKMSAVSMYPMCVRASRGLLRLRQGANGSITPAVLDVVRSLSADTSSSSATGGLAQAILQDRLQQQKSQVSAANDRLTFLHDRELDSQLLPFGKKYLHFYMLILRC